jgi:hypothetical protein
VLRHRRSWRAAVAGDDRGSPRLNRFIGQGSAKVEGNADVTVTFKNTPPGTRVRTRSRRISFTPDIHR